MKLKLTNPSTMYGDIALPICPAIHADPTPDALNSVGRSSVAYK